MKILNRATPKQLLAALDTQTERRYNFVFNKADNSAVIDIFNDIDDWWGYGANSMRHDLAYKANGGDVTVRVNSYGGVVTEGFAIANLMRQYDGGMSTLGMGIVASAATFILLAGDRGKKKMAENSFLMIHNAWAFVSGGTKELESMIESLKKMNKMIVDLYVATIKSNGKMVNGSEDETRTMIEAAMDAETWYTAKEALAMGFIDEVVDAIEFVEPETVEEFEEAVGMYNNVPNNILNKINSVKMAKKAEDKKKTPGFLASLGDSLKSVLNLVESEIGEEGGADDTADTLTNEEMIEKLQGEGYSIEAPSSEEDDSEEDGDGDDGEDVTFNQAEVDALVAKATSDAKAAAEAKALKKVGGKSTGEGANNNGKKDKVSKEVSKAFDGLAANLIKR